MSYIQRKFNAFVEGQSLHFEVEGVNPPNIKDATDATKAGGLMSEMDIPMGIEKLEAGFKLNSRNKLIMKRMGLSFGVTSSLTFRSVNVSEIDGGQEDEVITIAGRLGVDNGEWAAQGIPKMDYKVGTIWFYKHTVAGELIHHIDIKNTICLVDGSDQWASYRSGLGF